MANEIMKNVNVDAAICVFNDPEIGETFSSFSPESTEGKIALYNAINSPNNRITDCINQPIHVKDVVVTHVKLSNFNGEEADGEEDLRDGFRVILIDTDGQSYTATSNGIYNSIKTLRSVFGTLHFEDGITMVVKQIKTKRGNTLNLTIA